MKICFVDLDNTLITVDSFKLFLLKWIINNKISSIFKIHLFIMIVISKLLNLGDTNNKKLKEDLIKTCFLNTRIKEIENFLLNFSNLLFKKINKKIISRIHYYKKKKYLICLATASPDFYVKKFASKLGIKKIISTKTLYSYNFFKIVGNNCKGIYKKKEILKSFPKINSYKTIFYTDDLIDLPVINICNINYIVSGNVIKKYKK